MLTVITSDYFEKRPSQKPDLPKTNKEPEIEEKSVEFAISINQKNDEDLFSFIQENTNDTEQTESLLCSLDSLTTVKLATLPVAEIFPDEYNDKIEEAFDHVMKYAEPNEKIYVLEHIYNSSHFDLFPNDLKSKITEMRELLSKNEVHEINLGQFCNARELKDARKFEVDERSDSAKYVVDHSETYNITLCNHNSCALL